MTACGPSRWPGGPQQCLAANLPSFESAKAAKDFFDSMPAVKVGRIWECQQCGGFHGETHIRAASGDSSGSSTREATRRIPAEVNAQNAEITRRRNARYQAKKQAPF